MNIKLNCILILAAVLMSAQAFKLRNEGDHPVIEQMIQCLHVCGETSNQDTDQFFECAADCGLGDAPPEGTPQPEFLLEKYQQLLTALEAKGYDTSEWEDRYPAAQPQQ